MKVSPSGITISFGGTPRLGDEQRAVVARIFGFAEGEEDPTIHDLVVPAGESVEQLLPQGLYSVQLTLPSGRLIQRNIKIDKESNETFHFNEDPAPNPGFSLQESILQRAGDILADAAMASGNSSAADYADARQRAADQGPAETGRGGGPRGTKSFSPSSSIDVPQPPRTASLAHRAGLSAPLGERPPDAKGWQSVEPVEQRGDTALWRIAQTERGPPTAATRRWARIGLPDGGIELASLPLPWLDIQTEAYLPAEVLVDPARQDGAATSVAVRDSRLGGLLAFLDRGQAVAARPLLAELERGNLIERTISLKFSNPLAACAAAYVGLAVYPPTEQEQWDGWLQNCMVQFPDVPDAAVVHARRLVLRPTSAGDNQRAADALRGACSAGVPFFSTGVFLLRDMLVLLSVDHADLKPLAERTGMLASRVDPSQAFTVLRFAPPREAST